MNQELKIAKKAFEDFEKKVESLEYLELELKQLNFYGFREEAKEIKSRLKDTSQIPFIESKLKELKEKINERKNPKQEKQRAKTRKPFLTWWSERKKEIDNLRLERQKKEQERIRLEKQKQEELEIRKEEEKKLRLEKQKQEDMEIRKEEEKKLRLEKQKQEDMERQKKEQEKLTEPQIDEIEKDIEGSSKKAPLVEDILKELDEEIKLKEEAEQKPEQEFKPEIEEKEEKPENRPLTEEQVERIDIKVEQTIKHKLPSVSELVQQTKQRFTQKKTKESTPKKEDILSALKETFELKQPIK